MKKKKPAPQKGITGIVLANQWDENGNVIGISVYTDREDVYKVAPNKLVKELTKFIQRKVRVEGQVKERSNGQKSVYIETVRTIEKENGR